MTWLYVLGATVVAGLAGWYLRGWWDNPPPSRRPRREPLDHKEYLNRRADLVRADAESIREYDRLVTWASGGGLLLSITFVEKLVPRPAQNAWLLLFGWLFLALALMLSLSSQYASSRTQSWGRRELDLLQEPDVESHHWLRDVAQANRRNAVYGTITKYTTILSGVALVAGLIVLASFAFQNVQ